MCSKGAFTKFFGVETDTGLDHMSSIGIGLELDSSAKDIIATRWRLIARYTFGLSVSGYSVGLAVSC
jgi:hypothetical protein